MGSYDRVVFCPPTQDPDTTTNLRVSADDRVEFPALSLSREISSVFPQSVESFLTSSTVYLLPSSELLSGGLDLFRGDACLLENGSDRGVLTKCENEMVLCDEGIVLIGINLECQSPPIQIA